MKVKIQGEVTLPIIGEALTTTFRQIGLDPELHCIRGASIYFNVYDRKNGELLDPEIRGEVVDEVVWKTAEEREKERQKALGKKRKVKSIAIQEIQPSSTWGGD